VLIGYLRSGFVVFTGDALVLGLCLIADALNLGICLIADAVELGLCLSDDAAVEAVLLIEDLKVLDVDYYLRIALEDSARQILDAD
jgi:hypothetical protein